MNLCLSARDITDLRVRPGGQWVSGVLSEPVVNGTSNRLVMWNVADPSVVVDLLIDPAPTTGRGLSGGVHVWDHDGQRVFVCTKTDGVVAVTVTGDAPTGMKRLPFDARRSWSTPAFDYMNRSLFVIADWQELWGCTVDAGDAWCAYVATDGFAIDAAAGVEGMCHTWQRPHMPWTQSTIHPEPVTAGVAVQQPRFNPDGTSFGYIDDATGFANVRILADQLIDHDVVITDDVEHGGPVWGPGQRTWCFNSDGTKVAYTRNEQGFGSLWVFDRVTSERTFIGRGIHGCLWWENNTLAALRTGARTPTQVVVYDMSGDEPVRTVLVQPADPQWFTPEVDAELVEPTLHTAELVVDGDVEVLISYRLYRAAKPNHKLIVWIHGGPTDQWNITFRPRLAFWLSRGWSICVVDHRGTTGHGREFVQALEGHWGDYDAIDTACVIAQVQRTFGYRPGNTIVMGGSAGGLTALNAISLEPSLVRAAVLNFPVVDLGELLRGDDPFETHYMPTLIGSSDPESELVYERSPLSRADTLAGVPLLVFHGDQDHSVPLVHSERLLEAVTAAGGQMELVVMEGEGHGFKNTLSVIREYSLTEEFLQRIFGTPLLGGERIVTEQ